MEAKANSYIRSYYNLVTDMFEHFLGRSFHYFHIPVGKPISSAVKWHEEYLAAKLNLQPGQKVLDVGSGVGGPARQIAKSFDVQIVGLNNNDYQIQRAMRYTSQAGLQSQVAFVKGDFMQMHFEPESFDAAYAIEATCYAPSLKDVYLEIFKTLKPGGILAVYELVMTDSYDDRNSHHRLIRYKLEKGMGVPSLVKSSDAIKAFKAAGFELKEAEDLANRPDSFPWWYPFTGSLKLLNSLWDAPRILWMALLHSRLVHMIISLGEMLHVFPPGTREIAETLFCTGRDLAGAGEEGLFTPLFIMVGQKPLT